MATKFWGLVAENGRRYSQKAERGYYITMATLEPVGIGTPNSRYDEKPVHVMLDYDGTHYILCTLWLKEHVIQAPLNIPFGKGEVLSIYLQGGSPKTKVHLTGFYSDAAPTTPTTPSSNISERQSILVSSDSKSRDKTKKRVSIQEEVNIKRFENEEDEEDDEDDNIDYDEDDSDDDDDNEGLLHLMNGKLGEMDEDDEDDDDDDDDDDDEFELEEDDDSDEPSPKEKNNGDVVTEQVKQKGSESKKHVKASSSIEFEDVDTSGDDDNVKEEVLKTPPTNKKLEALKTPENKKIKKNKEMVTPENQNIPAKSPSSAGHTPMKFVSKGGLMIHELKVGNGSQAKQGKMVTVYYSGRLKSNNRQFDSSTSGPGFKFRLGKGEVIKGWDLGLDGMKVGGKRRIIIPSHMAYGKKGAPPDIPPNSTLVFEIELKNVS